jgi:O-antigen ligase
MLVYQQALRGVVYFNHAHNHYLHVLAEGGLLLGLPVAGGLLALARVVRERLDNDEVEIFWIRAGAACALLAVAIQSIWETGLRMPANAILCAVVAAIAVHEPAPPTESMRTSRRMAA